MNRHPETWPYTHPEGIVDSVAARIRQDATRRGTLLPEGEAERQAQRHADDVADGLATLLLDGRFRFTPNGVEPVPPPQRPSSRDLNVVAADLKRTLQELRALVQGLIESGCEGKI